MNIGLAFVCWSSDELSISIQTEKHKTAHNQKEKQQWAFTVLTKLTVQGDRPTRSTTHTMQKWIKSSFPHLLLCISQWLTGGLHSPFTRFSKCTRYNQRRFFVDSFPALLRSCLWAVSFLPPGLMPAENEVSLMWHILSALSYAMHRGWTLSIFYFFPPNHLAVFVVCKRKLYNLSVPFLLK